MSSPSLVPMAVTVPPTELLQRSQPGPKKITDQEAAQMFEGMLMLQLVQAMRKTIEPSGLFGNDKGARQTYDYLLDQAIIERAVKAGKGFGLARRLEPTGIQQGDNLSQAQ